MLKQQYNSIILLLLIVFPHTIVSIIPSGLSMPYQYFTIFLGFTIFSSSRYLNRNILIILFIFLILGLVSQIYSNSFKPFNLIMPFYIYFGYNWMKGKIFNKKVLYIGIISLISIFYLVYFSKLPSFFNRGIYFQEDFLFFDNSSSNAVSMGLVMSLLLLELIIKEKTLELKVLSILTFILCLSQGSRIGIVLALLNILYIFDLNKNFITRVFIGLLPLLIIYIYWDVIVLLSSVADLNFITLIEDGRILALIDFFNSLNGLDYLFGNQIKIYNTYEYTYNFILDFWDNYTVFGLLILIYFFKKKYKIILESFPMILIFVYGLFESNILPMYWDSVLIYSLFYKADE